MTEVVKLERKGRIGVVVIDNPPVNAISHAVRAGLARCFEAADADDGLDAIVLRCEGRTFIAGADIGEFDAPMQEPGCHAVFQLLDRLQKPVVAAIHGTALGGGLETALACHYRVADGRAQLGFPEITLGIVPGAGGTQRLPRVVGVEKALDLFLTGRRVGAAEARDIGLVDAVADSDLEACALRFAQQCVEQGRFVVRARDVFLPNIPETTALLQAASARAKAEMPGRVVPGMVIGAVTAAVKLPFDQGIARETAISDASLETVESRAMRRLFFAERATAKVPGIDPGQARGIAHGGIVGGGTMGRGIAMAFANAGLPVTLLDVDRPAVEQALGLIRDEYGRRVSKGKMSDAEVDERMALIHGAVDYAALADADVVIEAVFEVMALKKDVLGRLDAACKPGAILASNTSTLDVAEIASATGRPGDVVGLHFFSPAQVMRLLEIVRTDSTADDVIATSMALAKKLRKTGVLSGNSYGFIGNRMMEPYGREAERMVLEGVSPRRIDDVLQRFGMAMGILAVYDMAGVDVGYKVRQARPDQLPDDPAFCRASTVLAEHGMLGQKTGSGFYRYEKGSRERLDNPVALALFAEEAQRLGIRQRDVSDEEIEQRCLYALINEGAKVLEEGVALRAADVDVVYTSGYGFPRFRGGPMFHADTVGLAAICERIDRFARDLDPRYWQVANLLRRLAHDGGALADYANA